MFQDSSSLRGRKDRETSAPSLPTLSKPSQPSTPSSHISQSGNQRGNKHSSTGGRVSFAENTTLGNRYTNARKSIFVAARFESGSESDEDNEADDVFESQQTVLPQIILHDRLLGAW